MATRLLIVFLLFAACTATSLNIDTSSRFGRSRSSSRSRTRSSRRSTSSSTSRRSSRRGSTRRSNRSTKAPSATRRRSARRSGQSTKTPSGTRRRSARPSRRSTKTPSVSSRRPTRRSTRSTKAPSVTRRRPTRRSSRSNKTPTANRRQAARRSTRSTKTPTVTRRRPARRSTRSTKKPSVTSRGPARRSTRIPTRRRGSVRRTPAKRSPLSTASKSPDNRKQSVRSRNSRLSKRGRRTTQRAAPSKSKKTPIKDAVSNANTAVSAGEIINSGKKKITGRGNVPERRVTDSGTRRGLQRLGSANTVYGLATKAWNLLPDDKKRKVRESWLAKRASSTGKAVQPVMDGVATGVTAGGIAYKVAPRSTKNKIDRELLRADNKIHELKSQVQNRIKNPLPRAPKLPLGERAKYFGSKVWKAGKWVAKKPVPVLGQVSTAHDIGTAAFKYGLPESTQDKIKDRLLQTGAGKMSGAERRIARHGKGRYGPEVRARAAQAKAQRQYRRDRVIAERQRLRKKADEVRAAFPRPKTLTRRERRKLNSNPSLRNRRQAQRQAHEDAEVYAQELRKKADNLRWKDIQDSTK